jgi:DNA-binding transcriptional ArsR family regulator
MRTESPITRAIAELETEREHLKARLGKVDEAIASLRDLFHLPAKPVPIRPTIVSATERDVPAAIVSALTAKPLSPAELASAVGVDRHTLRQHVIALERAGKVVSTGVTVDRQIALAAAAPKEAIRR